MSDLLSREVTLGSLLLWAIATAAIGFAGGGATASGMFPDAFASRESVSRNERRIDDLDSRIQALERATTRIETQLESIQTASNRIESKLERALR